MMVLTLIACLAEGGNNDCQPYYPRIFWNPAAQEIITTQIDHIFMFNTNISCPYSFIQIYYASKTLKYRCQ